MSPCKRALQGISLSILLAALLFAAYQHYVLRGLKFDDAWIHIRYAMNVASGKGFVYNDGEKVLGSAGILWDLLLAISTRLLPTTELPLIVSALNYTALLGCVFVLVSALDGTVPRWFAFITAAALTSHGPLIVSSIGGMETSYLCLLYLLCFRGLVRGHHVSAALAAGAACCLRIESLVLLAAVYLRVWLHDRESMRAVALSGSVIPGCVFGWSWWYFGSPLANSTSAKALVYSLERGDAARRCITSLLQVMPFDLLLPFAHILPAIGTLFGFAMCVALALFGYRLLRREAPGGSLIALQAVVPFAFYTVANPLMFPWYFCTFVPVTILLVMLGLFEVVRILVRSHRAWAELLVLSTVIFISIRPLREDFPSLRGPDCADFSFFTANAREHTRTYQYANIARWLNSQSKTSDRVCISEIGAFGYFYHGRILDGLGLVSPEVLRFHPVPLSLRPGGEYGVIPPAAVRAHQPEFVVSLDIFAGALFRDNWFLKNYREIGRWDWYGGPVRWRDLPSTVWDAKEIRAFGRR